MRPALALLIALFASSCASQLNVAVGPAAWPLRGTPASDASEIHRRPLVVKVANDPGARPQTGIADADLIIELPVEGGLTRRSVVFQSKDAGAVGPVRSARQSDLNYLPTLHAILAHVGASESVTPEPATTERAPSVDYPGTGSGPVVILRDGKPFAGTWTRQGTEMYPSAAASGTEIRLKPGLTWMHIAPTSFDLSG